MTSKPLNDLENRLAPRARHGTALLLAMAALAGCSITPERYMERTLGQAAHGGASVVDEDFRLAVCGWRPEDQRFEVASLTLKLTGDDKQGSGEADTTFVASGGSPEGFRCEGRVAFDYKYRKDTNVPAYYMLRGIHRTGSPAAIVATVEQRATALALDAPATATFGDGWKLPDGALGAAYRVDLPAAGRYKVSYDRPLPHPSAPRIIAYQNHESVPEGSSDGALGFWQLGAGPAWFLLTLPAARTIGLRITAATK
jgi:hypothetical protein